MALSDDFVFLAELWLLRLKIALHFAVGLSTLCGFDNHFDCGDSSLPEGFFKKDQKTFFRFFIWQMFCKKFLLHSLLLDHKCVVQHVVLPIYLIVNKVVLSTHPSPFPFTIDDYGHLVVPDTRT